MREIFKHNFNTAKRISELPCTRSERKVYLRGCNVSLDERTVIERHRISIYRKGISFYEKYFKQLFLLSLCLCIHSLGFTQYCVQINTFASTPINPVIINSINTNAIISRVQINNPQQCDSIGIYSHMKLFGKIECFSPTHFTITLNPNYQPQNSVTITKGTTMLPSNVLTDALGNLNENNLVGTGVDLVSIADIKHNIILPTGTYRICFYARYFSQMYNGLGGTISDPNLGCFIFNVCSGAESAPQFMQPVNNLNINSSISIVQPASPVIFTWTPPQSTCGLPPGGFNYDFEIRELFDNQNVNDAINNPYVFRKALLPSTTFLLDTNLYKNVLQAGKKYTVRVRAVVNNAGSNFEIDNNGYSRIEAFQYGGNVITQNGMPDPQDYYIQFDERKSDYWDDVYEAYKKHKRGDTLVPIKEYIALALTENGTAYNSDAIELFLALNPELADLKKVKISYVPKLPEFPAVPVNDQKNFDEVYKKNLEPDDIETNKFQKYLDTLNTYNQKISGNAISVINDLRSYLNTIKSQVGSVDRVTVNLMNQVLSELLYELRQYPKEANKNQYNQLLKLSSALQELTVLSPNGTSFFYSFPAKNESSLSSYKALTIKFPKQISSTNFSLNDMEKGNSEWALSAIMKQLLPFDVIVWRNSTIAPYKPVLDAPDLNATYRIFYTLSGLYNHKNPEVNAKSTSRLASTVQISLPSNAVFSFWTLNMLNHKMTQAEDVDLKDVWINSTKNHPGLKKPSIVLKVN